MKNDLKLQYGQTHAHQPHKVYFSAPHAKHNKTNARSYTNVTVDLHLEHSNVCCYGSSSLFGNSRLSVCVKLLAKQNMIGDATRDDRWFASYPSVYKVCLVIPFPLGILEKRRIYVLPKWQIFSSVTSYCLDSSVDLSQTHSLYPSQQQHGLANHIFMNEQWLQKV